MTTSLPMSHAHTAATTGIVTALRASLPRLLDRIVARIRREIPFYATEDVVRAEDLRASVQANVIYILDSLTGQAPANLTAPDATGRMRAAQDAQCMPPMPKVAVFMAPSASRWCWGRR